ncbi:MAG: ATP-binding cassette domain-containing protein [Minwuiales bacterium]|nr:ATP-binding cassette domain-containing protein [Minwuiales bacterium]
MTGGNAGAEDGPAVALSGLKHEIGERTILDIADWTVARDQHALLLGPSGSGKTTLIQILAGLTTPTAGRAAVAGQDLAELSARQRDRFRGRQIGIVFQTLHLVGALTVAGNLRLARYMAGLSQDEARLGRVLDSLGIGDKADATPHRLSQGEAQRVAIARAVINEPALILADEPTSALDDDNCARVVDMLSAQAAECGATLLIATHDGRIKKRFENRLDLGLELSDQP